MPSSGNPGIPKLYLRISVMYNFRQREVIKLTDEELPGITLDINKIISRKNSLSRKAYYKIYYRYVFSNYPN